MDSEQIDIQFADDDDGKPPEQSLREWCKLVLADDYPDTSLCIRSVSVEEMTELNQTYRNKTGPTNVLSFPADFPHLSPRPLGDIVICSKVIKEEALAQHKELHAHWAHMVIHGILHLLGDTHDEEENAAHMEAKEIAYLAKLGYPNPYHIKEGHYDG